MKHLESRMQVQCVKWFRLQYRQMGDLLIHVPNGGSRDLRTAQRLKAEGGCPRCFGFGVVYAQPNTPRVIH